MKLLVILALIAASLPELLPQLLPAQYVTPALALTSLVGAVVTGLMRSPLAPKDTPPPPLTRPVARDADLVPTLDLSAVQGANETGDE